MLLGPLMLLGPGTARAGAGLAAAFPDQPTTAPTHAIQPPWLSETPLPLLLGEVSAPTSLWRGSPRARRFHFPARVAERCGARVRRRGPCGCGGPPAGWRAHAELLALEGRLPEHSPLRSPQPLAVGGP